MEDRILVAEESSQYTVLCFLHADHAAHTASVILLSQTSRCAFTVVADDAFLVVWWGCGEFVGFVRLRGLRFARQYVGCRKFAFASVHEKEPVAVSSAIGGICCVVRLF
jgi:hypothetical protein